MFPVRDRVTALLLGLVEAGVAEFLGCLLITLDLPVVPRRVWTDPLMTPDWFLAWTGRTWLHGSSRRCL